MPRFFNRIRKKLAKDNKFFQYSRYAIGEILLVVIGILIALQIDTWNEARKDRIYEKAVLAQIKQNLMQDRNTLEGIAKNFQGAVEATGKLLKPSARDAFPDSIPYWLGKVAQFDRFQPLTNSYEALKSKGLDIISSDTVRLLLGQYYDDKIATSVRSIGDIEISFNKQWMPLMENHVADFKFKGYLRVANMDSFINQTNALRILTLNRDNYGASRTNIQSVIRHIDLLLSKLP